MLPFKLRLTNKSEQAQVAPPLWHPNFCNPTRLPDTKVVRTTFAVNIFSLTVMCAALVWTGYREWQVHNLNQQVAAAQASIERNKKQHRDVLRQSKVFADLEHKLGEAQSLLRNTILPSDFVLELANTLPKEIQIDSMDMRYLEGAGNQCILHGVVAGTKDQASGTASRYIETLHSSTKFANVFEGVYLNSLSPDPKSGYLIFNIGLKFKSEGKKR